MLQEIGGFDGSFFLYSEDTDLGLAQGGRAGSASMSGGGGESRYSHTAGRASPLKAYLVERNRLFVIAKNFPPGSGQGAAGRRSRGMPGTRLPCSGAGRRRSVRREGGSGWKLVYYVLRSNLALAVHGRGGSSAATSAEGEDLPAEFQRLLERHSIAQRGGCTVIPKSTPLAVDHRSAYTNKPPSRRIRESSRYYGRGRSGDRRRVGGRHGDAGARRGAMVLSCPTIWGLAEQYSGYKLAYELGYHT